MTTLDRIAAKLPGGMPALNRALSRSQVESLEKTLQSLATDPASESTLAPVLGRAMAILAKADACDSSPSAAPISAEALLGASLTTSRALSSAQVQAALRAYRMVAGL